LVCPRGIGFSVGAPLPDGAQLATLRRHALRNGLQSSGRRGIIKIYGKVGLKQILEEFDCVLAFFKTNFCFE
jgi:hypothetical protein